MNHEDLKVGKLYMYHNEVVIYLEYLGDYTFIVAKKNRFYGFTSKEIHDVCFSKLIGETEYKNKSIYDL